MAQFTVNIEEMHAGIEMEYMKLGGPELRYPQSILIAMLTNRDNNRTGVAQYR